MDDEALNEAFKRVKEKFNDNKEIKEAYRDVRDSIYQMVRSCADNVRVVVYVDDILDDPIIVGIGSQENRLRITIKTDGKVTYSWTKQTWGKLFRDVKEKIKSIAQRIVMFFNSIGCSESIECEERKQITSE